MYSLLLALIYLSFISLGLPDSLLGSAWPEMQQSINAPLSYGGILSFLITGGTILSSLGSGFLIRRFQTGWITLCSVLMTAIALWGFSQSNHFFALCFWCIPYGLGAGAVDAVLNHFVALRYEARHMNWLHCFWGIGATAGPSVMGYCISKNLGWQTGYGSIAIFQIILVGILFFSLPLWKKEPPQKSVSFSEVKNTHISPKKKGIFATFAAFFFYSALELTAGLWGSSYLRIHHGFSTDTAANWAALFYLGITAGRFCSGFLSIRFQDAAIIRIGEITAFFGILFFFLPLPKEWLWLGLFCTGMGCAPVFPSLLHVTPIRFGASQAQLLMGTQMAFAYLGSTSMPPFSGAVLSHFSVGLYPVILLCFLILMTVMTECAKKQTS